MIHLLVEPRMMPIPADIKIVQEYGSILIKTNDGDYVHGDHMAIDGSKDSIAGWLRMFDGFFLGKGIPMLQYFEIHHVRAD